MRLPWTEEPSGGYVALTFRGKIEVKYEDGYWVVRGIEGLETWSEDLSEAKYNAEARALNKLKGPRWDFPLKSGR